MMEEKKMDRRVKFTKEKTRQFCLRLNTETEQDLIEQIKRQPSMQGYIKRLIREDIEKSRQ